MWAIIANDVAAITLTGTQRLLTQRMTKAALELQVHVGADVEWLPHARELAQAVRRYDEGLSLFELGGQVSGPDGRPMSVEPVSGGRARRLLLEAHAQWVRTRVQIDPVLGTAIPDVALAAMAANDLRAHNDALLQRMTDLGEALAVDAREKTGWLRHLRVVAASLVLLDLVFLLSTLFTRLRREEGETEALRRDRREVLALTREGMMRVDRNLNVDGLRSASLARLLG